MIFASLLLNLALVSALSISLPVREIRDNASPSLVPSNNPSALTLPSPIRDFEAKVTLGKTSTLRTLDAFTNAIYLMFFLSTKPWEDYIHVSVIIAITEGNAEIVISPSAGQLRVKHAVWGLYDTSVAISQRLFDRRGSVPLVYTGLFLHGHLIGFLKMQHKSSSLDSVPANNTLRLVGSYGDLNITSDITQGNDRHSTISAHSETVIDDEDSKFKIRYTRDTVAIKPSDIFTAFMDGIATAAEFDDHTATGAFINAVAASGDFAINVHGTGLHSQFTWALLLQTLSLVFSSIIWPEQSWNGLDFDVIYDDLPVGAGYILAMSPPLRSASNGTRVAASQK